MPEELTEVQWVELHRNPAMEGTEFDDRLSRYVCNNCGGRGNLQMSGHLDGKTWICPKRSNPVAAKGDGR